MACHLRGASVLGAVVAWVGRNPVAVAFGVAWPVAMFCAVVMTGNHFILDAVFGGIVAFIGFGIALLFERLWHPASRALAARLPATGPGG